MSKPYFVTFEGGEGAGKSTLMEHVAQELLQRKIAHLVTREPGGSPLGERIREILLHHAGPISFYAELALFLAARAQHIQETIRPALHAGKWVLCDRFNDSTIAYQGAGRGLGMQEVANVCCWMTEGFQPDVTIYLDIDPLLGMQRAKTRSSQDRIEAEALSFHQKIREAFLILHQQNPERIHLLDASQPIEVVCKQAMAILVST